MEQQPLKDENALADLFTAMKREARRERLYRRYLMCIRLLVLPSALAYLYLWTYNRHIGNFVYILNWFNIANMFISSRLNSAARKKAMMRLTNLEDVRAVGPLADALAFTKNDWISQVEAALSSLLPLLRANDAPLLNTQQRTNLHRALSGKRKDLCLRLAILRAFEQVGDSRDVAAVEHLTSAKSRSENYAVYEAAVECMPYLHANIEREQANKTLLRPSDGLSATPDTLLRAAHAGTTTPAEQLLRISSRHDGPEA